ncbi:prepilin-type N-terminal cleavage/methylation domain-containing protein [Sinobacterium caligoides]|uniref:Prepilin-type N-terminal cleavage/methylation domain-containing protein n=1 Tax=Sinobacterium caligoides TaxID=933926 RepID=A0A3N2DKK9_9GAMM|nr:PilW family protein [Sinobacterium caligoides]ROS00334.1 prepilin-type N-terminal cleavage/methylation domain-containing protein [Sinobacterium caligoides]
MRIHKQGGFTLIELMVTMALSGVVLLAASQVMVGSNRMANTTDNSNRVQENGRFASAILTRQLRMAGFRDPKNGYIAGMFDIGSNCAGSSCTSDGGIAGSDAIAMMIDPSNDVDCAGNDLTGNKKKIVVNRFYLATQNQVNGLMCRSYIDGVAVGPETMLVAGIDDFQVLYGIRDSDNSVRRYVSADRVGTDWREVIAVKFALLASSGAAVGSGENESVKYIVLDRATQTFNDRQARKVFTTTLRLNNALSEEF